MPGGCHPCLRKKLMATLWSVDLGDAMATKQFIHISFWLDEKWWLLSERLFPTGKGTIETHLPADLSRPEEAERLCDLALRDFPAIDILINNVGGRRINTPTEDLALADWQRILDLNLTHAFILTKRLGASMIPRRWGRIINISSINAFLPGKAMRGRSYETSKGALTMFTKAVAADWAGHGITVNAIAPGPFLTDANRRWIGERPEFEEEVAGSIPMGRWGRPEEIAPLALYLASEASSYMTGSVLVIDGGRLLW